MHDTLSRQPFRGCDVDAWIVGRIGLGRERAIVVPSAKQHRASFWNRHAGLLDRGFQIGRPDLGTRRNVTQVDADALNDAVLQRVLVDRRAAHAEMARRVNVSPAVVGHGEVHHRIALDVAGIYKRFFVGLPHAVNDRRMSWVTRRAVIEISAQIDDPHRMLLPVTQSSPDTPKKKESGNSLILLVIINGKVTYL